MSNIAKQQPSQASHFSMCETAPPFHKLIHFTHTLKNFSYNKRPSSAHWHSHAKPSNTARTEFKSYKRTTYTETSKAQIHPFAILHVLHRIPKHSSTHSITTRHKTFIFLKNPMWQATHSTNHSPSNLKSSRSIHSNSTLIRPPHTPPNWVRNSFRAPTTNNLQQQQQQLSWVGATATVITQLSLEQFATLVASTVIQHEKPSVQMIRESRDPPFFEPGSQITIACGGEGLYETEPVTVHRV